MSPLPLPTTLPGWLSRLELGYPVTIDLGLERIAQVAAAMGISAGRAKVMTVAGTNGKGSTVATADQVLRACGYRVGRYMSPHLHDFRERAVIQGSWLPESAWLDALGQVEKARGNISLTYFEFTTLAVLHMFMQMDLDVWVLEVGLGGRLDAVNIIDPDVAVISSIGIDHVEWLGPDRASIAKEKAGIMRRGRPVVIGDDDPPASLLLAANGYADPVWCMSRDLIWQKTGTTWFLHTPQEEWPGLPLPTVALGNAATALAALQHLELDLALEQVRVGLSRVQLPGRLEFVPADERLCLDVAHNPQGARFLRHQLQEYPVSGQTWIVLGMLVDKDVVGTLEALQGWAAGYFVAGLQVPRGASAASLAAAVKAMGELVLGQFDDPVAALKQSSERAAPGDRIVVMGSFYTVAAVRQYLGLVREE
ncbi:MAG: bifunctional tetrahydrofolate synthase/dihydrofolate synthase [Pseudomonadales bacterium]|nr:bifunctional tetrahydrofolate synthase/dihydrofolate synthase [Pseudomonadales bacterium]